VAKLLAGRWRQPGVVSDHQSASTSSATSAGSWSGPRWPLSTFGQPCGNHLAAGVVEQSARCKCHGRCGGPHVAYDERQI